MPSTSGALRLEVDPAEPLGAEMLVHGRLHGADTHITVKLVDELAFEPGATLSVDPAPEELHVLDAETGVRI